MKVQNDLAGKKGKCPLCGAAVRVPRLKEIVATATSLEIDDLALLPPDEVPPPVPSEPTLATSAKATLGSWLSYASEKLPNMGAAGRSLEPYIPSLRQYAYEQTIQMGSDFIRNEECMTAILGAAYTVILPAAVRLALPKDTFVRFGLSQIDRIFGPAEMPNK